MHNTKNSWGNIKITSNMTLRARKMINKQTTPSLPENNEKSTLDTTRKILKEDFTEHETKTSEMTSN